MSHTFRDQFPDFPPEDMPSIPATFEDCSWHNNACPSFASDELGLLLWVDYLDPLKRDHAARYPRFRLERQRAGVEIGREVIMTDDWRALLGAIYGLRPVRFTFADEREWDGFELGSTWNGFDSVAVTKETRDEIIAAFREGEDAESAAMAGEIEPMKNGLYSFAYGWATSVVERPIGAFAGLFDDELTGEQRAWLASVCPRWGAAAASHRLGAAMRFGDRAILDADDRVIAKVPLWHGLADIEDRRRDRDDRARAIVEKLNRA